MNDRYLIKTLTYALAYGKLVPTIEVDFAKLERLFARNYLKKYRELFTEEERLQLIVEDVEGIE